MDFPWISVGVTELHPGKLSRTAFCITEFGEKLRNMAYSTLPMVQSLMIRQGCYREVLLRYGRG